MGYFPDEVVAKQCFLNVYYGSDMDRDTTGDILLDTLLNFMTDSGLFALFVDTQNIHETKTNVHNWVYSTFILLVVSDVLNGSVLDALADISSSDYVYLYDWVHAEGAILSNFNTVIQYFEGLCDDIIENVG